MPLTGWGRTGATVASVVRPPDVPAATAAMRAGGPRGVTARGLGRAYGDAAQNGGGLVLDATSIDYVGPIDAQGRVVAGGGTSLDTLIRAAIPAGWFLPVTPGTRHVTLGGAIASDVHGKNHHRDGSFGEYVDSITLLLPSGETRVVTPASDPALFWATTGGMGLTGMVLEANIRLTPAPTRFITVDTFRTRDLDHTMALMSEYDTKTRYSFAWIDLVSTGSHLGRSVLTCGDHAPLDALSGRSRGSAQRWRPRPAPLRSPRCSRRGSLTASRLVCSTRRCTGRRPPSVSVNYSRSRRSSTRSTSWSTGTACTADAASSSGSVCSHSVRRSACAALSKRSYKAPFPPTWRC